MKNRWTAALCLALIMGIVFSAIPAFGPAVEARAASTVKLNRTKATLYSGKTLTLRVSGTDKAVKWLSDDITVARVNKKGVVTARKAGKTVITAKVGGKALKCSLTVRPSLSSGTTKVALKAGKSKTVALTWKLKGALKCSISNASVVDCSLGKIKDGKGTLTIKAKKAGKATVTLTNDKTADVVKIKVTVKAGAVPAEPVVDRTKVTVKVGKTVKVKVTWPWTDVVPWSWHDQKTDTTWGEWDGNGWPLIIKGVQAGSSVVTLKKGEDGEEVARIEVKVG
ncbi:MAG: Ig-like domain-containing protein [Clostridia bacterium]|nr:Ig-like domain-containing protein [Clostridia bacterium]